MLEINYRLLGSKKIKLKTEHHIVLPAPQRGPQVVSSVWAEQEEGGRRGDGPERRTTSEGRLVNSGSAGKKSSQQRNINKMDKTALCVSVITLDEVNSN